MSEGIDFFTPPNLSQQLASMNRPKGYKIPAHIHKPVLRQVKYTQETLFIKNGRVKINFYDENKKKIKKAGNNTVLFFIFIVMKLDDSVFLSIAFVE